jgi:hypothetical protein
VAAGYTSLAKQGAKSAIAFFQITTPRRASLLLLVGTFSFSLGLGYGLSQRQLDTEQYAEDEPTLDIPIEPKPSKVKSPPKVNIKIKAVGDIVPGTNYPQNRLHPQKKILFQSVKPILKGADFLFGNFESTLTNYPYSPKGTGGGLIIAFRTPPSYTQLLKEAGFDVMSVANNHSFDFSVQGLKTRVKTLKRLALKPLGKKVKSSLVNEKVYLSPGLASATLTNTIP